MAARDIVLEMVARLAASPNPHAQREALRLAERYREVILSKPAPWPEPGSDLAVEAMGQVLP
jgi:hypothetical protein